MTEDASLESFLSANPSRHGGSGQAWCCNLPDEIQVQLDAVVAGGSRRWKAIATWLVSKGLDGATAAKVEYHAGHLKAKPGD